MHEDLFGAPPQGVHACTYRFEFTVDVPECCVANEDHRLVFSCDLLPELFEPLGYIHDVADNGVVDAAGSADIADEDNSSGNTDAHIDGLFAACPPLSIVSPNRLGYP